MKKVVCILCTCIFMCGISCLETVAFGESKYVSITEMISSIPDRWTGEYTTKDGDTVMIDTTIVVPKVDTVPIVRITWDALSDGLDESLILSNNSLCEISILHNYSGTKETWSDMEAGTAFDDSLPWDDASTLAIGTLEQFVPSLRGKQLTCYYMGAYGDSESGEYRINFYNTFHGIPFLVDDVYRMSVESEYADQQQQKDGSVVPYSGVFTRFQSTDKFWAIIHTEKEMGVDIEDVPLLSFDEILKVLEQRVVDGYVHSLNEVRFGYMVFIDPEKKGEEYVLVPVWAAKGRTTGDPKTPIDMKTSDEAKNETGYNSYSIIVINAQTGEPYEFIYNTLPNRRYVPKILLWDDVK